MLPSNQTEGDNGQRGQGIRDTGDWALNLYAAVVRQAVADSRNGSREAARWLWTYAPSAARMATDIYFQQEN